VAAVYAVAVAIITAIEAFGNVLKTAFVAEATKTLLEVLAQWDVFLSTFLDVLGGLGIRGSFLPSDAILFTKPIGSCG